MVCFVLFNNKLMDFKKQAPRALSRRAPPHALSKTEDGSPVPCLRRAIPPKSHTHAPKRSGIFSSLHFSSPRRSSSCWERTTKITPHRRQLAVSPSHRLVVSYRRGCGEGGMGHTGWVQRQETPAEYGIGDGKAPPTQGRPRRDDTPEHRVRVVRRHELQSMILMADE